MKLIEKTISTNFKGKSVSNYIYEFNGLFWKIEKDYLTKLWNLHCYSSGNADNKTYVISLPKKNDLMHFIEINSKYINLSEAHKLSLGA